MKQNEEVVKSIDKKLSVVISILLRIANNNGDEITLREQTRALAVFGLNSAEIADILGKKMGHISKELSIIKKERK